jgi:hypothetical protein
VTEKTVDEDGKQERRLERAELENVTKNLPNPGEEKNPKQQQQ